MPYFVEEQSVVRRIWGNGDIVILIFAGAAAEFALNKAVDWLYFTGRLPSDPIGRLFSTVSYAQGIIFSEEAVAHRVIDSITAIHRDVEKRRGGRIPDRAYRDVHFMLIDYSIRAYEILERKLIPAEKQEIFDVFQWVAHRMGISGLPQTFAEYEQMRAKHLESNLEYSEHTADLFTRYRSHLGAVRYTLLLELQKLIVPQRVRILLGFRGKGYIRPVIRTYQVCRSLGAHRFIRDLVLPSEYRQQIRKLDYHAPASAL